MKKPIPFFTTIILLTIIFSGCKSLNKTQAETGQNNAGIKDIMTGMRSQNTMMSALLEGVTGGNAGVAIGKKMDSEAAAIQKAIPGAQVKRIGEGINITFESGFLFGKSSADISGAAEDNLQKLATFFTNNPNTKILIEGHTSKDSSMAANEEANMQLSQQRSVAVSHFLQLKGVDKSRITEKWYGDNQPKYPNDTEANRQKNRRVEIGLIANEAFKKMAQEGKVKSKK